MIYIDDKVVYCAFEKGDHIHQFTDPRLVSMSANPVNNLVELEIYCQLNKTENHKLEKTFKQYMSIVYNNEDVKKLLNCLLMGCDFKSVCKEMSKS